MGLTVKSGRTARDKCSFWKYLLRDKSPPSRRSGIGTFRELFILPAFHHLLQHCLELEVSWEASHPQYVVKQNNWGYCVQKTHPTLLDVSKIECLLCVHSGEPCTFTTIHFHLWELLKLLGKQVWFHTHQPLFLCSHCVSVLHRVHCTDTLPAHSFHMWKQYLSPKTLSSAPHRKELNSLKNYFEKKINLAVKLWRQWTDEVEIEY